MMKNLSVGQRVLGVFAVLFAVLAITDAIALSEFWHARRAAATLQQESVPGLAYSGRMATALAMDYALTEELADDASSGGPSQTAAQLSANAAELGSLEQRYQAMALQAEGKRNFETLKSARIAYAAAKENVQRATSQGHRDESAALTRSQLHPAFRQALAAVNVVQEYNAKTAQAAADRVQSSVRTTLIVVLLTLSFTLVFCVVSGRHLIQAVTKPLVTLVAAMDVMRLGDLSRRVKVDRDDELGALATGFNRMADELVALVGQVQRSGIQVSSSLTEIAATSKQQQATATEIAATTTEVGATSKEISATSKELLRTMGEVSAAAERTATLASNGQTGVSSMEGTMRQVTDAATTINAKLGVLNEKASNINQVVTTIMKVADQTNLLSLNAAIEAEKAGEYGRGFAVVATEIRRLADQTGVATYDIEQMVKEVQSAISASVMGMDKFSEEVRRGMSDVEAVGGQLSEIIHQVQVLVPHFEMVNEGMQGQAVGAEQISEALLQLTEAAQQTVESLRQSTESISDLNQVSGDLRSSVSRFKLSA